MRRTPRHSRLLQVGDRLGEAALATPPPAGVDVRVRAVRVTRTRRIDVMPVFWDHQRNGDTLYAYRRSPAR